MNILFQIKANLFLHRFSFIRPNFTGTKFRACLYASILDMAIDIHLRCCSALPSHCLISFACVSLHPCVAKSCALDPTAKRDLPELSRCWNLVPFFKSVDFTAIFCHMHDFQVWTKRLVQYAGGFGGGDFDSAVSAYFQVLENAKGH